MNTTNSARSGFALGTVLVLALVMLASVGALLAYATNEYRSARRNQLATAAFHLAEQGIELGIDALASDAYRSTTAGWSTVSGRSSRYKRSTTLGADQLTIYIDDIGSNSFLVRAAATSRIPGNLEASRAIRAHFSYVPSNGRRTTPGPAIGGNRINLNFNGAANNEGEANRYACFDSRYGKPVWNPREYYTQSARPDLWFTPAGSTTALTNCFDGFQVVGLSSSNGDCNIGAARIYGHVATPAASVSYAWEPNAPNKPAAWVGEMSVATTQLGTSEKPYAGWVELPDVPGYASQLTYNNANTLIDGKCIEQGNTAMDTSWFTVPAQPTLDVNGAIANPGGSSAPIGAIPVRLGNQNGNNVDYVNYTGGGTVTWPTSGEGAAVLRAENFDINQPTNFVINGPVTLIVTGTKCGFAGGSLKFGPNGSLTVFYSGQHATLDKVLSQKYEPARLADGTIDTPANQGPALARAADCYDPTKIRFNCTNPNGGDFVIHTNDSNKQVAAEIIAPYMTVRLHAASSRSTFIGRLLGNTVETTNSFDFFYDLNGGGGDDDDLNRNWTMGEWRQILPSAVSDSMPTS